MTFHAPDLAWLYGEHETRAAFYNPADARRHAATLGQRTGHPHHVAPDGHLWRVTTSTETTEEA